MIEKLLKMRFYRKVNGWWKIQFSYDAALVKEVKKFAGANYNPENKEWNIPFALVTSAPLTKWLKDNGFIEGVYTFPSKRFLNRTEPSPIVNASDIKTACIEIGLHVIPRPYQCEGIAYMINYGNCINGDDCGLGKTGQQIATIEILNCFPALIITPASVKYNWKKEWGKWNPDRSVAVVDRAKKKVDWNTIWNSDVVIINFDLLNQRGTDKPALKFKELLCKHWGCCAIDEIHFLKNEKALRTKLVLKITARIRYVWGLTGTLTQNKPADLIQPFKIIRKFDNTFGSVTEFKFRYCDAKKTPFGVDWGGFSNLDELHKMLQSAGYIRRNKRDVLKELPPLITQVVDVPITNIKEYRRAESDLISYLSKIDINKANNAVNAPHLVMIQTLKRLSIEGKIKFIKKYIEEWLEANENDSLLVFGVHREPLQELSDYFKSPVIQGGVDSKTRQKLVDEFSRGKHRVLFANIQSAGTGMDGLQSNCSTLIYIEYPDRSTDLEQTTARLERMGQRSSINVIYLASPDTIDVEMREIIESKDMITGIINRGLTNTDLALKFKVRHE